MMKAAEALKLLNESEREVPDDVRGVIFLKNYPTLRKWAADNAFSIIFLMVMFFITWIILVATNT